MCCGGMHKINIPGNNTKHSTLERTYSRDAPVQRGSTLLQPSQRQFNSINHRVESSFPATAVKCQNFLHPPPRHVRELLFPFSSKKPDFFSSPVLNMPYSSTQLLGMSHTSLTLFLKKNCVLHPIFRII